MAGPGDGSFALLAMLLYGRWHEENLAAAISSMLGTRRSGAKSKLEDAIVSVVDAAVGQSERVMHCFAAVPVLVAQYSLVLFSHILDFKNATGPRFGH